MQLRAVGAQAMQRDGSKGRADADLSALRSQNEILQHGHGLALHVAAVDARDEVADAHLMRTCSCVTQVKRGQGWGMKVEG
jgi:hypothetical protein